MHNLSQKPGFLALVLFVNTIALSENLVKKIRLKKEGLPIDRAGILVVLFK
jgi:hypothetical protein